MMLVVYYILYVIAVAYVMGNLVIRIIYGKQKSDHNNKRELV